MQQSINVPTESILAPKPSAKVEVKTRNAANTDGKPSENNSFSRVMGKAQNTPAADSSSEKQGDESSAPNEVRSGNHLPANDGRLPDEADMLLSLDLKMRSDAEEFDADEAILLATRLVVESLPEGVRQINVDVDLRSSGAPIKVELFSKLEASMKFLQVEAGVRNTQDGFNLERSSSLTENISKIDASEASARLSSEPRPLNQSRIDLHVPVRIGSANWGESIAGRISLMINQRLSSARIHINPPELGPIEVRLNLNSDQVSVQFISHSSQVRDALEQSIPRLREMLESAGILLENSFVGDQSSDDRPQGEDSNESREGQLLESDGDDVQRISLGLIDQYV